MAKAKWHQWQSKNGVWRKRIGGNENENNGIGEMKSTNPAAAKAKENRKAKNQNSEEMA
jgi:hypothetical protein